jgi:hypothetical protein
VTFTSRNANREASLEMSLNATKSLLSDYALRTKQAEETVALLMREKLDVETVTKLAQLVTTHMDVRSKERAVHQQAILQTTLIALSSGLAGDEETLRTSVNNIIKSITAALGHMNTGKRNNKPPSQPE